MEYNSYETGDEKKSLQERIDERARQIKERELALPKVNMSGPVKTDRLATQPEKVQTAPVSRTQAEVEPEVDEVEAHRIANPRLYYEDGTLKPLSERIAEAKRAKEVTADGEPRKETAQEIVDRVEAEFDAKETAKRADEKDEGFWGTVSSMFTGEDETEYNREYTGAIGSEYKGQVLAETSAGSYDLKEGEYTQNDLYRNDEAFNKVFKYMESRYGLAALEGKSREEVVDRFLNNRRGATSGNSVRVLSELTWSIKATEEDKEAAREAYALFDNMGGVLGKNTTFAEKAEGVMDYARSAVLDPVNLLGPAAGLGRVGAKTGARAIQSVAKTVALKEGAEQVAKGASREVANAAAKEVYKKTLLTGNRVALIDQTLYGVKTGAGGLKGPVGRLLSTSTMKEVGVTFGVDATTQGVAEYLNQRSYINTEYTDHVDAWQVGLTTLFAGVPAAGVAGAKALRGASPAGVIPSSVVRGKLTSGAKAPKGVFEDLSTGLKKVRKSGTGDSLADSVWSTDVDLGAIDGTRFEQMMYGVANKKGEVQFKGLVSRLSDVGITYNKEADGPVTEWMTKIIRTLDDSTAQDLAGALGVKNAKEITSKEFANVFETKITQGARSLAAMSAVARNAGKAVEDVTPKDTVHAFFDIPVKPEKGAPGVGAKVGEMTSRAQDAMVRAMVTHPGTTYRNVVGFAGVAGINMANELASSVLYATRGGLGKVYDALSGTTNPASSMYLRKAKNAVMGLRDQVSFILDPSMTKASFDSHTSNFTKEMEALSHIRAGGIDTGAGLNLDSNLSFNTNVVLDKLGGVSEWLQTISLVSAQDDWSKSLSFTAEMNKQIRDRFDVNLKEFYQLDNAVALMNTPTYKEGMAAAILKAQDETMSRSFKGTDKLGYLAGVIEDARKIPVIGAAVPFGRFFNNTLNFVHKNSTAPAWGILTDTVAGKAPDIKDISRLAVTGGLMYAYAEDAEEALDKGLSMFQKEDPLTGDVKDVTFDYPFSMLRAIGYVIAKSGRGESLTENEVDQLFGEAFGGSIADSPVRLFKAIGNDFSAAAEGGGVASIGMGEFVKLIGSQYISSFTRVADPYNTITKAATGQSTQDKNQYERKFLAESLRYLDGFLPATLFGGEASTDYKAAEGGQEANASGRILGTTNVTLTNTQRVMNMVGVKTWEYESDRKAREYAPAVANEMNRLLGVELEERATRLMQNPKFRNASQRDKEVLWKEEVAEAKDDAKLEVQFGRGKNSYMDGVVYKIVAGYSRKDLTEGFEVIGVPKDSRVEDLTDDQIFELEDWLQVADKVNSLRASSTLRRE